jgi:hypothetical protein
MTPLFSLLDSDMRKRAKLRLQKKDTELPMYGQNVSESSEPTHVPKNSLIEQLMEGFVSILCLIGMHIYREEITPDFWHFVTCLTEEEGHYLCCFIYWMIYKCFLLDAYTIESTGVACNNRVKAAGRSAVVECIIALVYSGSGHLIVYSLYIIGVSLAAWRYKYS